jgi:anaerobic magnesium-protoporphyrin IX monomethyl ester cyclase
MARIFLIDGAVATASSPFLSQPVGLLSLASVLRNHGHDVRVHDCKLEMHSLSRRLTDFQPHIVGIRTLTIFREVLSYLSGMVRTLLPEAQIIIGGPHANADPVDALALSHAACAVMGEGEVTIVELVEALLERANLAEVRGLALIEDEELRITEMREPIADLDTLPLPAYDLLPMELYFSLHHGGTSPSGRTMLAFTSRGCPYNCAFCHNIFGTRFRARSAEAVVDEFLYLKRRYQAEEIEIHDDAFNTNPRRVLDICGRLQEAGSPLLLSFPNGLRADVLSRELLRQLRLAGTHHTALSPETASPRLQKYLGKNMDLDKLAEMSDHCDELGIFSLGYFMLGFPTETEDEMLSTIEWACNSSLHTASFFNVIPFPGTRIHEDARKAGLLPAPRGMDSYHEANVNISEVPDERFREIWHGAYRRFYLDPSRVAGILRRVPNLPTLFRNAIFVASRFLN